MLSDCCLHCHPLCYWWEKEQDKENPGHSQNSWGQLPHEGLINRSQDSLTKHNSDGSEPVVHRAKLLPRDSSPGQGWGETESWSETHLHWTWERDGSINETQSSIQSLWKVYSCRGPQPWYVALEQSASTLRFPLQMAQIFHINLLVLCKRWQLCNQP